MSVQMAGRGEGRDVLATASARKRAAAPREKPLRPELAKFVAWSKDLVLDSGQAANWDSWQLHFLNDVFSGVPEAWLVVPEGNGKTTLIAALALYHCATVETAEVPIAASSREQAEVLYKQAEGFVLRSPELHDDFECLPGYRRIRCERMGSRMQVFAADDRTGDGIIPTLALVDELHRHRNMDLYLTWQGKLDKRHGQLVTISTAGEPGSDFEVARESIRQSSGAARAGALTRVANSQIVFHEWAVPEDGDVEDLNLVKSANPFTGITVKTLERKRKSPTWTLEHWKRFVCNVATRGGKAAITEDEWRKAKTDRKIPKGDPIWLGLDVAWKFDTTALVPYWQPSADFRLFGPATVLVPPRDGNSLDPNEIERALRQIHATNPIAVVVMDPNKAEQLAEWCRKELGAKVIERKQTNAYSETDYARFMEGLRSGWLHHTGDKALTRHVLNAITRMTPFGAARFDESHAARHERTPMQDTRVIDALVAAAMVHAQANEEAPVDDKPKWRILA